jgi:hypothetical protein
MKRQITSAVIAAGMVAAMSSVSVSAATASTSPSPGTVTLNTLKARANTEVQNREAVLAKLAQRVQDARDLAPSDRTALSTLISNDESGLTSLDARIQADSTLATARVDAMRIVTDFRVYVLVEPQVHMVIAADRITDISAKLLALEPKLKQAIQDAKLTADQRSDAEKALSDFAKQVETTADDVSGVSASALALTPAGYPGNSTTLQADLSKLHAARAALSDARKDVDTIRDAWRSAPTTATPAPSPSAS